MSKIIQPFGKVMRRSVMEVDDKGAMKVVAFDINPLTGAEVLMPAIEVLNLYAKFVSDMIVMMRNQSGRAVLDGPKKTD